MIQAARSGRQNIAEGSRACATSSQTELRLINVVRASLEELLLDFEDVLRPRHFAQWSPDSAQAAAVRSVPAVFRKNPADRSDQTDFEPPPCPRCGGLMALRTAKAGRIPGREFWGCTAYPECQGTVPV